MRQRLRPLSRCCRMAALTASLAAAAAFQAMPAPAQIAGPELCDAGPDGLSGNRRQVTPDMFSDSGRTAPRVVGLSSEQAEAALASDEIRAQVIEVRSSEPRGQVVNQWPAPGEPITAHPAYGTLFRLCVSNGEVAPLLMPDLAGRTLEQARQLLAARQIAITPTIRRAENAEPAGTVYSQSPEAGATLTADAAIVLNVSDGPPPPPPPPLTPAEPTAVEPAPAAPVPVESAAASDLVASTPPPAPAQGDFTRIVIPGILLVIALLAAGLITRSHLSQRRPRFRARLAGMPAASVAWGEPPGLGFECRLDPPLGRCRPDGDERGRADG